MEKITWTWKKIVSTVLGILGIGTLTSCYGVVPYRDSKLITGRIMGDIDGDNVTEPVPNISVSISAGDYSSYTFETNDEGVFYLDLQSPSGAVGQVKFAARDEDGDENGSFKTYTDTIIINEDSDQIIDLNDITLERL